MREKIDEINGMKTSKNIEFTKIITKDTSDSNLDIIESKMRSISQTVNRKLERNADKIHSLINRSPPPVSTNEAIKEIDESQEAT